jgi:DNA-3-methyladenine glycosylase
VRLPTGQLPRGSGGVSPRLPPSFYDRPVVEVARDLLGCVVRHGDSAGRIVETEAYHHSEPACHAFVGLTPRTRVLFGPPGVAYVYRSYGIHALLNAVCEPAGEGAAVLIRALEPLDGIDLMRARRGLEPERDLCSGPGKLTEALGIGLELNDTPLDGAVSIHSRAAGDPPPSAACERIGISRAVELPWRFCEVGSRHLSRPIPQMLGAQP